MKKSILLLLVSGFILSGCATKCDESIEYLEYECRIGDGNNIKSSSSCESGSAEACISECILNAPCSVFDGSLDPTDADDFKIIGDYSDCVADCGN